MPDVIDFPVVVERMRRLGLVSLYPNSGAFGFPAGVTTHSTGWVGPADPTIRAGARGLARHVGEPYEANLARLAAAAWRDQLPGPVWVLPKSHWAYELTFGSHEWLPALLGTVGVAADGLAARHDGSAVAFGMDEAAGLGVLLEGLLGRLFGSDFLLAWPDHPVVCTVHHHKQLWWTTTDPATFQALEGLVP